MSGSQRTALASQSRRASAPAGGSASSGTPAALTNSTQCATRPRSSHQRFARYLRAHQTRVKVMGQGFGHLDQAVQQQRVPAHARNTR